MCVCVCVYKLNMSSINRSIEFHMRRRYPNVAKNNLPGCQKHLKPLLSCFAASAGRRRQIILGCILLSTSSCKSLRP